MIFRHLLNMRSHPTWVRGLKHEYVASVHSIVLVAPYVGAWIETYRLHRTIRTERSRTLRGCVD